MIYTKNPLHLALEKLISEHRANINNPDETGFTPLMHAAKKGDLELVKSLIAAGAELDTVAFSKSSISSATLGLGPIEYAESTALMIAADKGYADIVESLLYAGADANLTNEEGKTALMIAANKGYTDIIEWLLYDGDDASLVNEKIETALDIELLQLIELELSLRNVVPDEIVTPVELLEAMKLLEAIGSIDEDTESVGSIGDSSLTSEE